MQNEQRACRLGGGLPGSIGDGFCDNINNNADCKFDGGDCCQSTCTANAQISTTPYPFECGSLTQYVCIDPSASDSIVDSGESDIGSTCFAGSEIECNACGGQTSMWPCLNVSSSSSPSSFEDAASFTGECVPITYLCDGVKDCASGSDELLSANYTACLGWYFILSIQTPQYQ